MKKSLSLLLALSLLIGSASAALAELPEIFSQSELRREVTLPTGKGPFQYYAQNDPVWARLIYEAPKAEKLRPFGDGGCNPTSLAMVVASLVPADQLTRILDAGWKGAPLTLCTTSLNELYCVSRREDAEHRGFAPETEAEVREVLPLLLGSFATGNNPKRTVYRLLGGDEGEGGTNFEMLGDVASFFGLNFVTSRDILDVFAVLDRGGLAIVLCSGAKQPFSGTNGHYMVLCDYDEEFLYLLDPFIREKYSKDQYHIIKKVDTGINKVAISNLRHAGFSTYALFEAPSLWPAMTENMTARAEAARTVDGWVGSDMP